MNQIMKDEVFNGEDYAVWRTRILSVLEKKNFCMFQAVEENIRIYIYIEE
jgi:hypothetical protein